MKVAFIGLGAMGYPMAGHLVSAGHEVAVFNRTFAKAQRWSEQHGGTAHDNIADAVTGCEIVFACVGDDNDVRGVCAAALATMEPGTLFVDHTTASAAVAEEVAAKFADKDIGFVDAPVSGGQAGAENGQLTIMCGGSDAAYSAAEPVMQAYAKAMTHMGPVGSGQKTKMVNQVAIAGLVQGLSEALNLGQALGLDMEKAVGAIEKGAAGSWQMSNRAQTMLADEFEFGFAVDWMRKDLAICLEAAEAVGADMSVTKLVDGYYQDIQEMGGNRWDTSSLIRRLAK